MLLSSKWNQIQILGVFFDKKWSKEHISSLNIKGLDLYQYSAATSKKNVKEKKLSVSYISVVSAGKWLGMWVNFLFLQSAMPSAHLQGVGQVQEAEGKHSKVSSSSKKLNNHKVMHNKDRYWKSKCCSRFLPIYFMH